VQVYCHGDAVVIDIKPGYFYSLGSFVHTLVYIRKDTPDGIRADIPAEEERFGAYRPAQAVA